MRDQAAAFTLKSRSSATAMIFNMSDKNNHLSVEHRKVKEKMQAELFNLLTSFCTLAVKITPQAALDSSTEMTDFYKQISESSRDAWWLHEDELLMQMRQTRHSWSKKESLLRECCHHFCRQQWFILQKQSWSTIIRIWKKQKQSK